MRNPNAVSHTADKLFTFKCYIICFDIWRKRKGDANRENGFQEISVLVWLALLNQNYTMDSWNGIHWWNCIDSGLRAFFHLILKPNTVHHWTDSKGTGDKPPLLSSVCESSDSGNVDFADLIKPFYLYIIYRNWILFLEMQVAWRNISTYINAVVTSKILENYY